MSVDRDYAACFAQLYDEEFVWLLTIDLRESEILDLTSGGLDAAATAAALHEHGFSVELRPEDCTHHLLWRIPDGEIRGAGYRAVRLLESADWGNGLITAVSLCLVDTSAIVARSKVAID